MIIEEIMAEIASRKSPLPPEAFPRYQDIVMHTGKNNPFTIYPDKSRSIDDIISVLGMVTSEDAPLLTILGSFLLHRLAGSIRVYFDDGLCTPQHTHNYAELGYVAEGKFHTNIEGRDYLFKKGELFLINKNIPHNEYLYRKNSIVLFLSIVNTFFDKSMQHDVYDSRTDAFLKDFVLGEKKKYQFIRFIPLGGGGGGG
jgi:mannose-6-phosphate isomerase-like protein (cupin superfamily)